MGPFRRMMAGRHVEVACGRPANGRGTGASGKGPNMHEAMLHWIWHYFSAPPPQQQQQQDQQQLLEPEGPAAGEAGSPAAQLPEGKRPWTLPPAQQHVAVSQRPALYLQHEGHSRTVIGIERRVGGREEREEFTLLMLGEPGSRGGGGRGIGKLRHDHGLPSSHDHHALSTADPGRPWRCPKHLVGCAQGGTQLAALHQARGTHAAAGEWAKESCGLSHEVVN